MIVGVTRHGSSRIFVGRRAELDRLESAFDRATNGQPSLVLVAGEAGVGKSRLVAEAASLVETRSGWTATGGCLDLGEGGLPYAPFVESLRSLVRRSEPDERQAMLGPTADVLAAIVPDLRRPRDAADGADLSDPAGRLARLFDAVIDALGRLSADRPLMVVLEDIHWSDGSTRDLIRFLVRNLRSERLLLVATYRTDDLHRRHPLMPLLAELERAERVERLELHRFDRAELAEQLTGILGEPASEPVVEALLERSDGIPFYVEELVARDDAAAAIPSTLRDILVHRLAALSPEALGVVRVAAVIGARFTHDRLAAVAGVPQDVLVRGLREAIDAWILVAVDDLDGPAYAFKHALLRETAYDDFMPSERIQVHARLADHLERLVDGRSKNDPSLVADLALHAYLAHDLPRALTGAVAAMQAFADGAAFREALAQARRAVELWPRVADAKDVAGMGHDDLLALAARIAGNAGNPTEAMTLDQAALLELGDETDDEALVTLLEDLWTVAWEAGAFEVAGDAARRAVGIVEPWPASSLKSRVLVMAGSDLWTAGRVRESVPFYERAMVAAREAGDQRAWVTAAAPLAHSLGGLGRAGRGVTLIDETRAITLSYDGGIWSFWIAIDEAMALWFAGRFEDSMRSLQVALSAAIRYGLDGRMGPFLYPIDALFELGRYDEAEELLRRAVGGPMVDHPLTGMPSIATRVSLVRGRLEEARATVAQWPPATGSGAEVWRLESAVLLARAEGRFDDVRRGVEEARTWALDGDCDGPLWFVLAAGVGGAADRAVLARHGRRPAEADDAAVHATSWFRHLASLAEDARGDGGAGAFFEATFATSEAEIARASDRPAVAAWSVALERWLTLRHPYQAAYARLRLAEALLAAKEDRLEAATQVRAAFDGARAIGATALLTDIEAVAARGRIDLGSVGPSEPPPEAAGSLTARERDVLRLVAEGHTNREIGDRLFISEKTVSVHVSNAMAKLGALSRYEAAATATRDGLL